MLTRARRKIPGSLKAKPKEPTMSKGHMIFYGLLLVLITPIVMKFARNHSTYYSKLTA